MGRKRLTEGGKHNPARPYVAMVEGTERGVPFRVFHKRMCCAFKDAQAVPGSVVTDLFNLKRVSWVNNQWKEV